MESGKCYARANRRVACAHRLVVRLGLAAMPFTVAVHHHPDYLEVHGSGPALLSDLCGLFDLVGTIAARQGYGRAVMNLLAIEVEFGFTDHLQLGSHAADRLRHLDRVASVVPARYRTGTSEKAAQKMGLQLRTFTSLDEGMAWLLSVGEGPGAH